VAVFGVVGSAVSLLTVAELAMTAPLGVPASTLTAMIKVAGVPTARLEFVQMMLPTPPTGGVVQFQPPGDGMDWKVVLTGMLSVSVTLVAMLGPLLLTTIV
jgi:hypothetical protein